MFKDVEKIPPFPAAAARLISEINNTEPDIGRLVKVISSAPSISAKVIQTVNSSLFALKFPVTDIQHAVTLLGLKYIREIAFTYVVMDALPEPKEGLFDHESFLADSLIAAMLAKEFARICFKEQEDVAFTASLLADIALPVLLSSWQEYYEPIIAEWKTSPERLSEIERRHFGWDHGQAGAWIAKSWGFPEEMVCYIASHNLSRDHIRDVGLEDTVVVPMAIAAMASNLLKSDLNSSKKVVETAVSILPIIPSKIIEAVEGIKISFEEMRKLFGLADRNVEIILDDMIAEARSLPEDHES
jgi:HD-like signal output (HDOD) protein